MSGPPARACNGRLISLEFHLPGEPIPVGGLYMDDEMREKLQGTGQEFTFGSDEDSTAMSVRAACAALDAAGIPAEDIGLVISAPTLITSYGLEIPAIALRAELGLENAECLNVAQGCVGFLSGLQLACSYLAAENGPANVLVVTACKASSLMDNFNHGSFFWADAAAAAIVSAGEGSGLHLCAYGERSSSQDWDAMRLHHGDARRYADALPALDLKLVVDFADQRAQMDYIVGERARCDGLISALLEAGGLAADDIDAVFLPSIGANRVPHLLGAQKDLRTRVKTDFRYAHMGGVDALFFLDLYLRAEAPPSTAHFIVMTPAYTAQWGGLLLDYRP
ncbi:MAG: hypothetical protein VX700_12285 [Pseudomonadota bacterium]|nr:hypothetical protein [Pseudomonadota bacterium]